MSMYAKGKEPACPLRYPGCLGKIASRGRKSCYPCSVEQKRAGVDAPAPKQALLDSDDNKGNTREITKTIDEKVRTLGDLIRVCEIDTEEWDIERWICNKWEQAAIPRAVGQSKKWVRESTKPIVTQLFQIKVWLRRKHRNELTLRALSEALIDDIREASKQSIKPTSPKHFVQSDWLFEFSPFDLHMGKYTWDEECPTNYDTEIAADLFNASLDFLLNRALKLTDGKFSRVLCVFGNDVAHIDSKRGQTTAGTPMDVDTRYIKVYRRIVEIHRRAITMLRQVAPVDVTIVPGNHDELTSFHLGEVLDATYGDDPHVTINNDAKLRKYYRFGQNLFGFTHGDAEKVSELPLTMAREQPEWWAQCNSREWHIGHKHISEKFEARSARIEQDLFSDKGVRIRRLTSLSGHDAWHTKHAYMDRRACEAFVFHREAGFTDHLSFNVDHFTGRPVSK